MKEAEEAEEYCAKYKIRARGFSGLVCHCRASGKKLEI